MGGRGQSAEHALRETVLLLLEDLAENARLRPDFEMELELVRIEPGDVLSESLQGSQAKVKRGRLPKVDSRSRVCLGCLNLNLDDDAVSVFVRVAEGISCLLANEEGWNVD